jgi:hypothetical protein
MKKVVVLTITHRFGTDVSVAATYEVALRLLYLYVREQWSDASKLPDKCPRNEDKAIDMYFSEAGREDESYEISNPQEIATKATLARHLKGG